MSRITEIELAGNKYPLNFSTKATKEIVARYGGLEMMGDALENKSVDQVLSEIVWLLWLLIDQGVKYKNIVEGEKLKGLTEEELEVVVGIQDILTLKDALFGAMSAGMSRTVEVEQDPKNASATQEK